MNELINELMNRTGVPVSMPFDKWCEKFAELIVRECMDNLSWHGHDEAVSQLDWFLHNKIRS